MNTLFGWILIVTAINYGFTLLFGLTDFSLMECLVMASVMEAFISLLTVGVWVLYKTNGVI